MGPARPPLLPLLLGAALLVVAAEGIGWLGRFEALARAGVRQPRWQECQRRTGKRMTQQPGQFETFLDLVRPTGYSAEEHYVTTDDGYVLTVHRVPAGPKSPALPRKPAVLFTHGFLAASDVWVLRGPGQDLVFMLVDAGYDVWLLNTRGNFYSKRHKKIQVKEDKFWRFSWHEFGVYDTASAIDHVLKITDQRQLSLIGHSMGATTGLVLLSSRPKYNAKVNTILSFAPVAIFEHPVPGPIAMFSTRYGKQLQKTLKALGVREIFPRQSTMTDIYTTFCQAPHIETLCQTLAFDAAGLVKNNNFDYISSFHVRKFLKHYPQGTSLDTVLHFRQILTSGKFRQYDFGPEGNFIRYNNFTPPEYPLELITTPVVHYYALNDAYAPKENVIALHERLPNSECREIPYDRFTHLDFLISNYTQELLYEDTIRTLNRHRKDREPTSTEPPLPLGQAIQLAKQAPTTVIV